MTTKIPVELSSTPGIVDGSNATAITIDSSENVGIGTTSPENLLHVHGGDSGSSYSSDGADKFILEHSDSVAIDIRTPASNQALILFSDGTRAQGLIGYNHSEDSLRFANSGNLERMRIDSSGRVGINRTPAISNSKLEVGGADNVPLINVEASGNTAGFGIGSGNLSFFNGTSAVGTIALSTGTLQMTAGAVSAPTYSFVGDTSTGMSRPTGSSINFVCGGSEAARFDSSRRFMVGVSAAVDAAYLSVLSNGGEGISNGVAGTNSYRRYYHTASDGIHRFKSSANTATLSNAGAWGDASDIAYKKDIVDTVYGLDAVKQFQPRDFVLKADETNQTGFIAQEMETVCPQFVVGEEGSKTINYGQITSVLTKAIQEQQEQIEQLKTEIQTLKGE